MNSLSEQIKSAALDMGYEKCGIIKISDISGYDAKLTQRIQDIPQAQPFYRNLYRFTKLRDIHPWAKSIVICVRRYGKYQIPAHLKGLIAKYYLTDSRIDENSKDFQDSLKFEAHMQGMGLKAKTERKFGITALRWAAMKAGLGLVRRNNFFYTESGSWVYLEAWLIDKELESKEIPTLKPCSEKCNLCVKACPTCSLSSAYTMNPTSCVSYLTTFGGKDLPNEKFNAQMGNWVFGCDVCQDVCPKNIRRWNESEGFQGLDELGKHISLEKILKMGYEYLENVMSSKFWYIKKEDAWKFKTNAINSMVNDYKGEYRESIYEACNDSSEKVREMAEWAIKKLEL